MQTKPDKMNHTATVLVFAGLDPTGAAGIQADIETLASLQVHALPIVTCLTVQDTHNVSQIQTVDSQFIAQQLETLLNDIPINAIKLGLLADTKIIDVISQQLKKIRQHQPGIPIIMDPILRAGGGANLTTENNTLKQIIRALREKIIPYCSMLTPNSLEAALLTGQQNLTDCAKNLLELGCEHVFITGEHENNPDTISNTLYSSSEQQHFDWQRQPHQYHGSGCTLASAISAYLAKKETTINAVQKAQAYTDTVLRKAIKLGQGQYHPDRTFTLK